jgi:integrase
MVSNELEQGGILSGIRFGLALLAYTDILLCSIWSFYKIRQTPVGYFRTGVKDVLARFVTPRGVQLLLARYARAAGLQRVTPHALRHSFCKNLVNVGVGLEKIALLAGHDSLETTRRYCEPSLQDLEQAVELVSTEE